MKATYRNGTMVADRMKLAQAKYIRRDLDTYEISWEPPALEMTLSELGLIDRENFDGRPE